MTVDQSIGTLGRSASEVGQPQVIPQYDQSHSPGLPAGTGMADPITSAMPFLYPTMQGDLYTEPNSAGLGDMWAEPSAHSQDLGASAYYHENFQPNIGAPWSANTKTQSTDWVKTYTPDGKLVSTDGPRTANDVQVGNHANINQGIGYYTGFNERPFYNTLAEVAPNADPSSGGIFYPDATYMGQTTVYNDGGIATTYNSPPDPAMNPDPPASAPPMGEAF
jgi:hypothetical protein